MLVLVGRVVRVDPALPLRGRILEVAQHLLEGKTNKEIANDMHICERTVKVYFTRMFCRYGIVSRNGLSSRIVLAVRLHADGYCRCGICIARRIADGHPGAMRERTDAEQVGGLPKHAHVPVAVHHGRTSRGPALMLESSRLFRADHRR